MAPAGNRVIDPRCYVSLHTYDGIQLDQYAPNQEMNVNWTRALRSTSTASITVPTPLLHHSLPDITPWLHWISIYPATGHEPLPLWTGPILKSDGGRDSLKLSGFDCSKYMQYTRSPVTNQWSAADPADIAAELWASMISTHGLKARARVRRDPDGDPFDYETTADEKMLDVVMSDLVEKGLRWTVVAGTPHLGPQPRDPVSTLSEEHFVLPAGSEGIRIVRDGTKSANDVMVRGTDVEAQQRVPLGGLNLQSLLTVDDVSKLSNVRRQLRQELRHTARIRDALILSGDTVLHPKAPVSIDELVPSARFVVEAYGLRVLMELESVSVTMAAGEASVSVSMENVVDLPELQVLVGGNDDVVIGQVL